MNTVRVYLFGRFQIRSIEQVLDKFAARKAQELFCYLLVHRDQPHPRETVANLLWPDSSPTRSKKYLRKTLWQLQSELYSRFRLLDTPVLLIDSDWLQLNLGAGLWIDAAVFEQAFIQCQSVPGKDLDPQRARTLQSAVDLYRGDLLENWYQEWCLYERTRLQNMYRVLLDKLIGYCEAHHYYDTGLLYATQSLRCDPARERTHRQLMRLHYLTGDRTTALRQYKNCVQILKQELDVAPTERTMALYEQIRTEQLDRSVQPTAEASTSFETMKARLPEIFDRLDQIDKVLADARR